MQSVYTADEAARALGVSLRTLYAYLSQGLLAEGRRVGRQIVYGDAHIRQGLLVRALADGGMGLDAIRRLLMRMSERQIVQATENLSALLEARSRIEAELANASRQLQAAPVELDLQDMGLDDPVALQARVTAGEFELQHLNHQIDRGFSEVRKRVLAEVADEGAQTTGRREQARAGATAGLLGNEAASGLADLYAELRALNTTLRDLALILAGQTIEDASARAAAAAAAERLRQASEAREML